MNADDIFRHEQQSAEENGKETRKDTEPAACDPLRNLADRPHMVRLADFLF